MNLDEFEERLRKPVRWSPSPITEEWARGHEGLAGASADAPRDGASDRLYRPGDFDHLRAGSGDQGDLDGRDQRVVVNVLTREELEARRLRILDKWPQLKDWPRACCPGHTEDDVREAGGPAAADAWRELDEIAYLLGET